MLEHSGRYNAAWFASTYIPQNQEAVTACGQHVLHSIGNRNRRNRIRVSGKGLQHGPRFDFSEFCREQVLTIRYKVNAEDFAVIADKFAKESAAVNMPYAGKVIPSNDRQQAFILINGKLAQISNGAVKGAHFLLGVQLPKLDKADAGSAQKLLLRFQEDSIQGQGHQQTLQGQSLSRSSRPFP